MSKMIVKSTEKAGIGQVIGESVSCEVEVCRLAGRSSYTVKVDGVCKGISRATAFEAWQWIINYFNIWTIEVPEVKQKKVKNKLK